MFHMFPMSHFLFTLMHYSHKYSFRGEKKMLIQCKILSPFTEVSVMSIAKKFYCQIFSFIDFFDETCFDTFETHKKHLIMELVNISQKCKPKNLKNDHILSFDMFLSSFFTRRPII